jgi:hypothetical protein
MGGGTGKLIFEYYKNGYGKDFPQLEGESNIFTANLDGTDLTPLTNGLNGYNMVADISPNGRYLLFFSIPPLYTAIEGTSGLYVLDLTAKDAQPLKLGSGIYDPGYKTAAWLDDSRVIFINQVPGGWAIFSVNRDGTDNKRVSQKVNGITTRGLLATDDKTRFFWLGVDSDYRQQGIWWTSVDGSAQAQLTPMKIPLEDISPDGSAIAWEHNTWSETGKGCCSISFSPISEITKETKIPFDSSPSWLNRNFPQFTWSQDGSKVFVSYQACYDQANNINQPGQSLVFSPGDVNLSNIPYKLDNPNDNIFAIQWSGDGLNMLVKTAPPEDCSRPSNNSFFGGEIKILNLETGNFSNGLTGSISQDNIWHVFWLPESK